MGETLLTYIIPLFNTEAFVLRCLQSVVNQGLRDYEYEVIVVDDGSTDGSRGIVEDFCREHSNVRLLCQDNAGVSAARNLALDQARGRYVQFVDSDDSLDAYMMAPLLKRAVDSDLDVLVFNALRKKKHYSHFSLAEALEVVASCNPKQCFLTHISHEMGRYSDVEQELPPNVHLSFDNLRYRIANHKSLLP